MSFGQSLGGVTRLYAIVFAHDNGVIRIHVNHGNIHAPARAVQEFAAYNPLWAITYTFTQSDVPVNLTNEFRHDHPEIVHGYYIGNAETYHMADVRKITIGEFDTFHNKVMDMGAKKHHVSIDNGVIVPYDH